MASRSCARETLSEPLLGAFRQAILAGVGVECDYLNTGSGRLSRNIELGAVALLIGAGRQYLLAYSDYVDDLRLFQLADPQSAEPLDPLFLRSPWSKSGFSGKSPLAWRSVMP